MSAEVLAIIHASPGRRWLGVISMGFLGFVLLWIAFSTPPSLGWQAFLLAMGAAALWLTTRMYQATSHRIELTEEGLRDSSGTLIAAFDDIQSMDRGFFAFKPSNGFLLKTKSRGARTWRPGLWWRLGKRIGIGGVTPGHQSKAMAEIIAIRLAQREMG
ncbi:MAG: hypothetical protein AAFY38_12325 [Pseudomonadota bacterium]